MGNKGCKEAGCYGSHLAKGFCKKHYDAQESRKLARKAYVTTPRGREVRRQVDARRYERKGDYYRNQSARYKKEKPYTEFLYAAKRRGGTNITEPQYRLLRQFKCFYCSGPLPKGGTALDRKDPTKGYTLDNVLPCCAFCNKLRNILLSPYELLQVIELLRALRDGQVWEGRALGKSNRS